MKPVLALVGRPNVGKSTLFNRLTKSRDAIVADFAGLTRDRHYGNGKQGKHEYIVIDTGQVSSRTPPAASTRKWRARPSRRWPRPMWWSSSSMRAKACRPRTTTSPNTCAGWANPACWWPTRAEGMKEGAQLVEFFELGLGEVYPISAAHGQGIRDLVELALAPLDLPDEDEEAALEEGVIKLAVAGRPNVGKSTLINTWLGEERLVAF